MFQPLIENITAPVLAVDLGGTAVRTVLYTPGIDPLEQYGFFLPSPEHILAERIRMNSAMRRSLFLYGVNLSRAVVTAIRKHRAAGLPLCMHPGYAAALAGNPDTLERLGIPVSKIAPPGATSIRAMDFDPAYWRNLLDMTGLPQPEAILVAATETGRLLDESESPTRETILQSLFEKAGEQGVDLSMLLTRAADPSMLRLCSIQSMTGFPVLDSAFAFVFGMLSLPLVAGRSMREGVVLASIGKKLLRIALVFQNRLFALLEVPVSAFCHAPGGGLDLDMLNQGLDDLRLGWMPREQAVAHGGVLLRTPALPAEAEGFRPMFITGPDASLLEKCGQVAGTAADSIMNNCWGLLHAYSKLQ